MSSNARQGLEVRRRRNGFRSAWLGNLKQERKGNNYRNR